MPQHTLPRQEKVQLLRRAMNAIAEHVGVEQGSTNFALHPRVRVPVIRFRTLHSGLSCDLSISQPSNCFKAEFVRLLLTIDSRLLQLYLLVRALQAGTGYVLWLG
jgi:DNA polymerase sigma